VAYGFAAERQLAWLSNFGEGSDPHIAGALCDRHAAAMQLPQGWWLDDRRTDQPTLFHSREHTPAAPPRSHHAADERDRPRPLRRGQEQAIGEQLALDAQVVPPPEEAEALDPPDQPGDGDEGEGRADHLRLVVAGGDADVEGIESPPGPPAEPWVPVFDIDDDLGGLLDASTPLLSRAFGRNRRSTARRGDRG
jgi:hypothetical protein